MDVRSEEAGAGAVKVVQVGPLGAGLSAKLAAEYGAVRYSDGPDAVLAVTSGKGGMTAALIDAMPSLRAIVTFGVGVDGTDLDAVRRRGLLLSNTPGVLTDDTADTAVALLLNVLRGFSANDRWVRAGNWAAGGSYPLTRRVSGSKVGILGLGRIGLAVARRLETFGVSLAYHNRRPRPDVPYPHVGSVPELAAWADVLVVTAAGGPGTRGLVTAEVIDALGPGGYLVNVSRGTVVDEDALVSALVEGRLAGAGLGVVRDEPHVPTALLALDNVVVLPHVGSATVETRQAMADLVLANVAQFFRDGTLVTPYDVSG
ncbi:2-hydroxyacid dehydrogenase [Cryptosporangium phraense]|uniref:2-hydroxyacid dehydrogenase n=1 Tax=Cryptosporangium phraense TaxID=2593070 RepID=A0A545AKS3_9ACTN|nr:2-hydroxyacid dehydrogenase [Cryptosporangium phraense]TQS41914.1 2-hydroxyacid dehydrogenase [Cryptosporangium phraense]